MNTLSDKELKQLFQSRKQEPEDNGFSNKVMRKIPHKRSYMNQIIGIFSMIGVLIFLFSGAGEILLEQTFVFISYITELKRPPTESLIIYLMITGGIFCTTLIAEITKK